MLGNVSFDAVLSSIRDLPFNLEFAVTYKCNVRCVQCNVWQYYKENPERAKKELTIEEIVRIFSSYNGFSVIGITGGEPFLRNDLTQIIRILAQTQRKLRILFITTNGQIPQLIENRVKEVLEDRDGNGYDFRLTQLVSLDGPRVIHDYIRGVKGAYDKAIDTIMRLSELRSSYSLFEVGSVTVCSPFNIGRFNEVIDEVARLGNEYDLEPTFCVWFEGQLYKNIGQHKGKEIDEFRKELIGSIPAIKRIVGKKGSSLTKGRCFFYDLLNYWLKNPERQVVPCGAAKVRYFLDPYGNVYPCTIYNTAIGKLRDFDDDFTKLINSNSREHVRRLVEEEKCPICCNTCETIPAMMANPFHTVIKLLKAR
ncbi:MAG: radical SAM protein [Methanocellales archaeon]|nr:radical SAM protein [Methanocellales archaeon]